MPRARPIRRSDHASFTGQGGPFPAHCVQGSEGSEFYPPIARALREAGEAKDADVHVVFKGFAEVIDSFGALPYTEEYAARRVACTGEGGVGCALGWTGERRGRRVRAMRVCACVRAVLASLRLSSARVWASCALGRAHHHVAGAYKLKCSSFADDINAPPDVLAVLNKVSMLEMLRAEGRCTHNLYVCGVALDFCVLVSGRAGRAGRASAGRTRDVCASVCVCVCVYVARVTRAAHPQDTAINARRAGFERVYIVYDASRAAHAPVHGFVTPPEAFWRAVRENGISLVDTQSVLTAVAGR